MEKDSSVISDFFVALSKRAYKENDLSDVTFALCEADAVFKKFFLDFFFGSENLEASEVVLEREVAYPDGSRPDFVIRTGSKVYFVEVKIWDCNHHFAQYKKTLFDQEKMDVSCLGYIANYNVEGGLSETDSEVFKEIRRNVHTWKEFADKLEKYAVSNNPLVVAYIQYLKQVCRFDDFVLNPGWKIERLAFQEVVGFIAGIRDSFKKVDGCKLYSRSSRNYVSKFCMGDFFELERGGVEGRKLHVWGWYGAYYEKDDAVICVEFENRDGWGKAVCDKFHGLLEGGNLHFYMSKDFYQGLDLQKRVECFFGDVIDYITQDVNVLEKNFVYSRGRADRFHMLHSMKSLPYAIERYFVTPELQDALHRKGFRLELSDRADAEAHNSHCGRYFDLIPDGESHEGRIVSGWVGMMFGDKPLRDNGQRTSKRPTFILEIDRNFANTQLLSGSTEGWYDDSWGWKCFDVTADDLAEVVIERARLALCKLLQMRG